MRGLLQKLPQRWVWIAVAALYCGWQTYYAFTEYHRRAHDPRAWVASVDIDLGQLDYRLNFADLQSVGLFAGSRCTPCDFSPRAYIPLFWGEADHGLYGVLGKGRNRLNLAFYYYGTDMTDARRRVAASVRALQDRFPNPADAIRLSHGGKP